MLIYVEAYGSREINKKLAELQKVLIKIARINCY
jgi:hypothetical protein